MQLTLAILIAALGGAVICTVTGSGPTGPLREAAGQRAAAIEELLTEARP